VKQGQNLSFFECDVFDERNRLIARANATMMAIHDERSAGRNVLHGVEMQSPSRSGEVVWCAFFSAEMRFRTSPATCGKDFPQAQAMN
jgi:hypothetical protein